ncbi:BRO family protein [Rothia koreensis]|uniref:BRO family protein n=1 Tax=Rothia koreensis TaxID=592378 RepID=UPI003FCED927
MELFKYQDTPVRTIMEGGEPWFVASDVAKILGYANASATVAQHVDLEDARRATLAIHEGSREVSRERTLVNESGIYALTFGSHLSEARKFRRWVTSEVLPTIRKTGSYGGTLVLTGPELMARALLEAQSTLEAKDAKIAELAPKADVFDELLTADGSYLVGDAAKILSRAGIETGQKRLFQKLDELGWTSKPFGRSRRATQRAVEQRLIVVKPVTYWDAKREERVLGDPQVRVTVKGLYKLRDLMLYPLELTA